MLAFIPSALIGMGLVFTVPLVLERGLSPVQAILVSLRLFARGWPSIVLLHGVMMALFFLALIPMGLGLIWVAPLYFNCKDPLSGSVRGGGRSDRGEPRPRSFQRLTACRASDNSNRQRRVQMRDAKGWHMNNRYGMARC